MATSYKTPGVYVEEISKFPPSIAEVETAIPAFIGYTEKAEQNGLSLKNTPTKIKSMLEFDLYFGKGASFSITGVTASSASNGASDVSIKSTYYLYDSLQLYFANGGGDCYIVSVGAGFPSSPAVADFTGGITALEMYDEPTLILFPDATKFTTQVDLATVQQAAIAQCYNLKDRFAILDLLKGDAESKGQAFRDSIGMSNLKYAAAYTPWIKASLPKRITLSDFEASFDLFDLSGINSIVKNGTSIGLDTYIDDYRTDLADITKVKEETKNTYEPVLLEQVPFYKNLLQALDNKMNEIPPSGAVAGIYCATDNARGVWKAPANVSLSAVSGVSKQFTHAELDALNIDVNAGKSINAIRPITGQGIIVMGGRTLAGNDNEWRYVPVRRFFNYVEESCKKSTQWAVFEPNDANLWLSVKTMIENFLYNLWRRGALAGAKPEHAYYVHCGLHKTMSDQDINNGNLVVEIGMAAVRPAEFIVLKFSHKLQES